MPRLPRPFAVAVVVAAIAVVGCTPDGDTEPSSTTSTSTLPLITTTTLAPGPSVTIGVEQLDFDFNPFNESQSDAERVVGNAVWATIYDIDPDTWERIPDAVLALPSQAQGGVEVHDDGSMTVQYQVNPNARWSDGVPISGADLAFTAEVMRDLALGGSSTVDPVMATVTDVDAAQNVAWISFSETSLAFEDALWIILPSHALEGVDIDSTDGFRWPTGGPFVAVSGTAGAELRSNPFYWKVDEQGRQLPLIQSVTFVPHLDTPVAAFNAGDVDVAVLGASSVGVSQDAAGAEIQAVPTPVLEHLTFNFRDTREASNPESLNSSESFRIAVGHSVDPAIYSDNELVYFESSPPGVLMPRSSAAFAKYVYDATEARSLLDQLEAASPMSVVTTTGNGQLRVEVAEALVPSFDATGIDLTPDFIDSVVFFGDILPNGTFDIGMWAWISDGGYQSTMALLEAFDPSGSTDGYNGWGQTEDSANDQTARFSEIVDEARSVTSRDAFAALVAEAEGILADELPILPLFQRASYAGVWANRITGVRHNATRSTFTWNIETWEDLDVSE